MATRSELCISARCNRGGQSRLGHASDRLYRTGPETSQVSFSRRYDGSQLREIVEELRMRLSDEQVEASESELRYEFA